MSVLSCAYRDAFDASQSCRPGCLCGLPRWRRQRVRPSGAAQGSAAYEQAKTQAHVQPRFPKAWRTSANPELTYTLLLKESPEFVRFINPGDLRIAQETCGQCHAKEVTQVRASLHTTTGVFWTVAAYNNGIWPFKTPTFGESYNRDGIAQSITMQPPPTEDERRKGVVPVLLPLPRWEILKPGMFFGCLKMVGC